MRHNPLYYLIIVLLIASCGKEVSIDTTTGTPGTGTPGTGTGTGTGTGGGTTTTGSYQPSTKNSYWKYRQTGSISNESTLTSKGEKRTVSGIPCIVYTGITTGGPQPASAENLLGIKGNDYFSVLKGVSPNSGAPFDIAFLYLNDALPEGASWTHTAGNGNGFTAFTPGKIVEKGITVTVEGKTYKDVIHTQVELQYEMPGLGKLSFITYDYYVAKNVGIIRVVSVGDAMYGGGIKTDMTLLEYSIK